MIWIIIKLDTSKFEFLYAISRAIFPIDTNINISPTSIQPIIIIKKKKKKSIQQFLQKSGSGWHSIWTASYGMTHL